MRENNKNSQGGTSSSTFNNLTKGVANDKAIIILRRYNNQ